METFKLLAIRPLENCNKLYSKNLHLGEVYSFYNDYEFLSESNEKVAGNTETSKIKYSKSVPEDLYNITTADGKRHNVNISAIVGKNGSGKSALTELVFITIYLLSVNRDILFPNLESIPKAVKEITENLNIINRRREKTLEQDEISSELEKFKNFLTYDVDFDHVKNYFKKYLKKEKKIIRKKSNYEEKIRSLIDKENEINTIQNALFVEIYYQISNTIFKIKIAGINQKTNIPVCDIYLVNSNLIETNHEIISIVRDLKIDKIIDNSIDITKYFFYTISINYSQYSLNSNFLGDWINSLFHKNDGYQTPIVINPMRDKGNYDINKEMKFAKYRLLSNILIEQNNLKDDKPIYISENFNISFIRFSLNETKIKEQKKKNQEDIEIERDHNLVKDLLLYFLNIEEIRSVKKSNRDYFDLISNYIVDKFDKILNTYVGYEGDYHPNDTLFNEKIIDKLFKDGSHITFKLHQAINFLQHNKIKSYSKKLFNIQEDYIDFSLKELIEWMGNPKSEDIIKNLPPPIFNFEIFLSNGKDKEISFNTLSSGEQQLIHSIQSVVYHINNLQSVYSSSVNRISYKYINILYDEIELYFHPEYQKRFINELLKSLEKLYLDKIEGINILFSSHSPFILSDIPSSNILKLKNGEIQLKKINEQTFGANINDILANDFFLKNGFMGEFVKDRINSVIDFITEDENPNNIWTLNTAKEFIELIGEPLIRAELRELFLRSFYIEENVDVQQLEQEIERLQNIIKSKNNDFN
ncbi:AAA family ATPase [Flavobacterium sp. HJSW_4]|uniref:AAA family ATPase n=1 Tax=Flavobacterium sp. HJSW_4 TaxID=3344660 RepID=UPI0035F37380